MAATIRRFQSRRDRLTSGQAEQLRLSLTHNATELGIEDDLLSPVIAAIDQHTASQKRWTFIMIGPKENQAVQWWLADHSKRPKAAAKVWSLLFTALRSDTGEIVMTRDQIAAAVGIAPANVTRIMTELETIKAVMKRREGRRVRYFMNPTVGTHLAGAARDEAQAVAAEVQPRQFDMVTLLDDYRPAKT